MSRLKPVDSEFASLLEDYLKHRVFRPKSAEARVVETVAHAGLDALNAEDQRIWDERVLPILAKPLAEQARVAAIVRNGGYVPRRIVL